MRKLAVLIEAFSRHPRGLRLAFLAGVLVTLPTLMGGLVLDDRTMILSIEGKWELGRPFDRFNFAPGDPELMRKVIDSGPYPWFAQMDVKARFFRPLSSALMELDHALFGRAPFGYHLHSIVWYAACLLTALLFYRRFFPGALGVLALLIFAIDDGHFIQAGWWSNRNSIVSALPALLGLYAHICWREDDWKPGLPLSLIGYALGLAGGETAIGIFGYLGAYELFGRYDTLKSKALGLLPAFMLAVGYAILYKWLDYGVTMGVIYNDPTVKPLTFLLYAPVTFVLNLSAGFLNLHPEPVTFLPWIAAPLAAVTLLIFFLVSKPLYSAWQTLEGEDRRHFNWLVIGALFSIGPALATFPSSRMWLLPSLGGCLVIALLLRHGLGKLGENAPRNIRVITGAIIILHIVLPPFIWVGGSVGIRLFENALDELVAQRDIDPASLPDEHVIIVNSINPIMVILPVFHDRYYGLPEPKSWRPLTITPGRYILERTGENEFTLENLDRELMSAKATKPFFNSLDQFYAGYSVELTGWTVTVEDMGKGSIRKLRVTTDLPADDPAYRYLFWTNTKLSKIEMPEVGQRIELNYEGALKPFLSLM